MRRVRKVVECAAVGQASRVVSKHRRAKGRLFLFAAFEASPTVIYFGTHFPGKKSCKELSFEVYFKNEDNCCNREICTSDL